LKYLICFFLLFSVPFFSIAAFAQNKVVVIPLSGANVAGTNGQIQYNDNGKLAGSQIIYDKFDNSLTLPRTSIVVRPGLKIEAEVGHPSLLFLPYESMGEEHVSIYFEKALSGGRVMDFSEGNITFSSSSVSVSNRLGVGVDDPLATLDVDGYAKLKSYDTEPFVCTTSGYGIISMNSNYDLCICRPYNVTKKWRKVADINQLCW